jgi:hypothetical protein
VLVAQREFAAPGVAQQRGSKMIGHHFGDGLTVRAISTGRLVRHPRFLETSRRRSRSLLRNHHTAKHRLVFVAPFCGTADAASLQL